MASKINIQEVIDKQEWTDFVAPFPLNSMLQSWNWGEFAKLQGRKVFRLGLYESDKLVGASLFTKVTSKRGDYLESHGGPMLDYDNVDYFRLLHDYLIELSKKEKVHFFRIRPPRFNSEEFIQRFTKMGYFKAPMYFQAEHTMHLNLEPSEDELLKGMKKNTRYYVRKGEQGGVSIRFSKDRADIDLLFDLYEKTVERHDFVPYNKEYFLHEFDTFIVDNLVELVFAEYNGETIGGAMIIRFGTTGYYHHSGSVRLDPDVYANYLLQWEVIKRLKQQGMKMYDFFGIAPNDDPNHPRAGLTKFKRGFGGERVRLMHTLDFPINHLRYWPLYVFVKYERWRRGW
ncbi:peptidoglycan bridge formation glycyltransferase FemA/FemB family protein [candidate division WWE3 bacterium]|uniref:Peptidoglycan bridge formation glycyltransferase FemA/FemB family protein n=1 Tax=candidate division WWE3 bacterium TaxID=2053526 RepID=A0A955LKE0_UNCKA|nr:peptidoglycan bridge formation glycyltransferase FemA/FemB family protein [candidate division WWE3 bacterium]